VPPVLIPDDAAAQRDKEAAAFLWDPVNKLITPQGSFQNLLVAGDLAPGSVGTSELADDNVTLAKLAEGTAGQIIEMVAGEPVWVTPEVHYSEIASDVTISATTAATANTVIDSGSITYENVPYIVHFYSHRVGIGASGQIVVNLWDGSTDLGRIALYQGASDIPCSLPIRVVPSAASHQYIVKAWRVTANGIIYGASSGLPLYIRIARV